MSLKLPRFGRQWRAFFISVTPQKCFAFNIRRFLYTLTDNLVEMSTFSHTLNDINVRHLVFFLESIVTLGHIYIYLLYRHECFTGN